MQTSIVFMCVTILQIMTNQPPQKNEVKTFKATNCYGKMIVASLKRCELGHFLLYLLAWTLYFPWKRKKGPTQTMAYTES